MYTTGHLGAPQGFFLSAKAHLVALFISFLPTSRYTQQSLAHSPQVLFTPAFIQTGNNTKLELQC